MLDWAQDKPLVSFTNETHEPWRFFQQKIFCIN